MSTIGVPSTASRSRTATRGPSTDTIRTRCTPIGFGPGLGARAEHAPLGVGRVVARMHAQDVARGEVQPREDDDLVARREPVEAVEHARVEHEPGVRRSLEALLGRRRRVGQRGLHMPDRRQDDLLAIRHALTPAPA